MQPQLLREIGEALAVLFQGRRLAASAPNQKLVEEAGQIRRTVRRVGHRFLPLEKPKAATDGMYPLGISELSNQISSIRNSTVTQSRARASWFLPPRPRRQC